MKGLDSELLLWFVNRATGVILLILMSVAVALGVLSTKRTSSQVWPRFVTQRLHRNISLLVVAMLVAHASAAIIDGYVDLTWMDAAVPGFAGYEPLWEAFGAIALDLTLLTVATSLMRHRFGLKRWRAIHLTTYLAWVCGLVHGLGIGTDQRSTWSVAITTICIGLVVGAGILRLATLTHERQRDKVFA